jgi:hypothetical protein
MLDPPLYRMVAQAQQEDVRREAELKRSTAKPMV